MWLPPRWRRTNLGMAMTLAQALAPPPLGLDAAAGCDHPADLAKVLIDMLRPVDRKVAEEFSFCTSHPRRACAPTTGRFGRHVLCRNNMWCNAQVSREPLRAELRFCLLRDGDRAASGNSSS